MAPPLSNQPYKGTRDFFPPAMRFRRWMFGALREVVESYGFEEYDGPMLEPFELYAAKTGEEIVNQQLYWMIDRGERKIAVRPEMTPTLARMVSSQVQELPKPIRWFSTPNLWRYERPQRGRLREHWQLNVDILGGEPLLADAEIIQVGLSLLDRFGGGEHAQVKVNNRRLMDTLFRDRLGLSPEAALQVTKAIDARDKIGEPAYHEWLTGKIGLQPAQISELDRFFKAPFAETARAMPCQGADELANLFALLAESGIREPRVVFDPTVMRGLDYYTGTVFEIYDQSPENRRAMYGGGRYDNLIGLFGNQKLSGVGFGMGDVTLENFLEIHGLKPQLGSGVDVLVTLPRKEMRTQAEAIARDLRLSALRSGGGPARVITPLGVDGFGAQLKQAAKHGARAVVLLGEAELRSGKVLVKTLATGAQREVELGNLAAAITEILKEKTP